MIQEASTRTKRRRPRYSQEQRAAIVAEYEAWEGGLMEFCRVRGVSAGSVCAWRRRLRGEIEGGKPAAGPGDWVEMALSPTRASPGEPAGGVWVEFRHGPVAAVRIAAGADPRWTARIVEALRCGG
jgi:hypothetical protein